MVIAIKGESVMSNFCNYCGAETKEGRMICTSNECYRSLVSRKPFVEFEKVYYETIINEDGWELCNTLCSYEQKDEDGIMYVDSFGCNKCEFYRANNYEKKCVLCTFNYKKGN